MINDTLSIRPPQQLTMDSFPLKPCQPYINWHGSKRWVIEEIMPYLPNCQRFFEPFAGSAIMSLNMLLYRKTNIAIISDADARLVNIHRAVRSNVEGFLSTLDGALRDSQELSNKDVHAIYKSRYYDIATGETEKAALSCIMLTIGIYGDPNFVRTKKNIPSAIQLIYNKVYVAAPLLQQAKIYEGDFEMIDPRPGDLIYCDPPYTGTYQNKYMGRWNDDDRLINAAEGWLAKGATVVISNMADWECSLPHTTHTFTTKASGTNFKRRQEAIFICQPS